MDWNKLVTDTHKQVVGSQREVAKVLQAQEQDSLAFDFWRLSKLDVIRYHDQVACTYKDCVTCDGLQNIEQAQAEIAEAEFNRNYDHKLQNSDVF